MAWTNDLQSSCSTCRFFCHLVSGSGDLILWFCWVDTLADGFPAWFLQNGWWWRYLWLINAFNTSIGIRNVLEICKGGQNSLLVVFGLAVHSVAGSILLWGKFSGRGNFSLGVNMSSNSISPKTLSDESINRGLVCAHMHFIAQTQKIRTFMS